MMMKLINQEMGNGPLGPISGKYKAEVTHSLELIKHYPARDPMELFYSQD